jgi:hypothetical protein
VLWGNGDAVRCEVEVNERDLYVGGLNAVLAEMEIAAAAKEAKAERLKSDVSDLRALGSILADSEEARAALALFMAWRLRGMS